MKKSLSVLLIVLIALSCLTASAIPAGAVRSDGATTLYSQYGAEFESALSQYPDLQKLHLVDFALPGVQSTAVGQDSCDKMVPQGICEAGSYILITARCEIDEYRSELSRYPDEGDNRAKLEAVQDHPDHGSVLYAINRESFRLSKVITFSDHMRISGVACVGQYIWFLKTDAGDPENNYLCPLKYNDLCQMINAGGSDTITGFSAPVISCHRASFLTAFGWKLWVGESRSDTSSKLYGYTVGTDDPDAPTLTKTTTFTIPANATGAAFYVCESYKNASMVVCTANGRTGDSHAYTYSLDRFDTNDPQIVSQDRTLKLPPMLSGICNGMESVYTFYQSASSLNTSVSGHSCSKIVDRVIISRAKDLFGVSPHPYSYDRDRYKQPSYVPSGQQAAKYVPNTILTGESAYQGSIQGNQLLFNPETALMLYDMSVEAYKLDDDMSWATYLEEHYGYEQFAMTRNGASYQIGIDTRQEQREHEDGSFEVVQVTEPRSFSACNAIIALKQVQFNGMKRYAIAVAFRGTQTDISDLLADAYSYQGEDLIHNGFQQNANAFYEEAATISFDIDGKDVTLQSMINDMCMRPDSKYCMLVTGHGLGGAIADILVGEILGHSSKNNIAAYTFGAPKTVGGDYNYYYGDDNYNIFNIINEDDVVTTIGGGARIGTDLVFTPDDTFREANYEDYEPLKDPLWWAGVMYDETLIGDIYLAVRLGIRTLSPHRLDRAYRSIVRKLTSVDSDQQAYIERYTPYHTNGDITWNQMVGFNRYCYSSFGGNVTTNNGVYLHSVYDSANDTAVGGNLVIGGDFNVSGLYTDNAADYILVNGDLTLNGTNNLHDCTLEMKGDFHQIGGMHSYYYEDNGNLIAIFSGSGEQTVTFDFPDSQNTFTLLYPENPNLRFLTPVYNLILGCGTTVNDDTLTVKNRLDLNGFDLTVNGNLTAKEAETNGGDLTVSGNLTADRFSCGYSRTYIGGTLSCKDGESLSFCRLILAGDFAPACLSMSDIVSYLQVGGDFTASSRNNLAKGTLELKGDLYQRTTGNSCFNSQDIKLIFSGAGRQTVSFENPDDTNCFGWDTIFQNDKIDFVTPIYCLYIENDTVLNSTHPLIIQNDLLVTDSALTYSGSVSAKRCGVSRGTLTTGAGLTATEFADICENSHMTVGGNLNAKNLYVRVSKADIADQLLCADAVSLENGSTVTADSADITGLVFIGTDNHLTTASDLTIRAGSQSASYNPTGVIIGKITVGGNLYADPGDSEVMASVLGYESVEVILSGSRRQNVSMLSGNRIVVAHLILENNSEDGVAFLCNIAVPYLFNHKGNAFTLYNNGKDSFFNDYDGDRMNDNVDPQPTVFNVLLGDSDGNGSVNILDATVIQRVLSDYYVKAFNRQAACVSGGELSIVDATYIQRYLVNYEVPYEVGRIVA